MPDLSADLLDQAEMLARLDGRRPKQANLRRSISASYYALFQLLAGAAATQASPPPLRARVQRALTHSQMKEACKQLVVAASGGGGKQRQSLYTTTVDPDLVLVAETFKDLQEERHSADYAVDQSFTRLYSLTLAKSCRNAVEAWGRVKSTADAKVLLAAMAFGRALER